MSAPLQEKWKATHSELSSYGSDNGIYCDCTTHEVPVELIDRAAAALDKAAELVAAAEAIRCCNAEDYILGGAYGEEVSPDAWCDNCKYRHTALRAALRTTEEADAFPEMSDEAANAIADFVAADAELRGDR